MHAATAPAVDQQTRLLPREVLERFDRPGPRYTSYPTADRFTDSVDQARVAAAWRAGRSCQSSISLYVHVPFCESVCYYCGCNKIITRDHDRAIPYLAALKKELDLVGAQVGSGRSLSALHLGGGTPTFFCDDQLAELIGHVETRLGSIRSIEMSIEVDPRTVTPERLGRLRALGFTRISFGVQDFDATVQEAVNRVQPFDDVRILIDAARRENFHSINVDLIYGLPHQTAKSFSRTIALTAALRPDRIALYAYAHLPQRFKPQRLIAQEDLPSGHERVAMLDRAIALFLEAGYDYIGMDHFALPTDDLAVAKRQHRLHRDFQGYGVEPEGDLLGIGVSAISRIDAVYCQNAKTLSGYYQALDADRLPVERGIELSVDDRLRRAVIMKLMCDGAIDFQTLDQQFAVDTHRYLREEIDALEPFVADGLVTSDDAGIRVTRQGWFLIRAIAMTFDRYLRRGTPVQRFSQVV